MKLLPLAFTLAATAMVAGQSVESQSQPADTKDARLGALKDLDGYFPWTPIEDSKAWNERAAAVRRQMQVSLGLHPWPTRTPLNAVVHGKIEAEDYTVEKAYFESMPGFFVTGSLYRPKNQQGPFPAVLCPHGHWPDGRFGIVGDAELKKEIANGGERFERGGKSIFQSLGVHLARMGCVAFVVDMIGYADSQQISFDIAHKFAKQRPEMNSPEVGQWGFYSPQAESNAQSIMGLQTWGNIRALDFLTSLPDVDAKRIGCTGGSGGGTQTMILGALDPRVTVAVPAVMVSTSMQGGCTCENACGLRIGTGNIEFAALFAPKPMAMTSAKDWTLEMPTKGYPDLEKHWANLGAPKNVQLHHHPEFGHNYNIVTREHIYEWFNEHLALKLPGDRLKEQDYEPLSRDQLTVWDDKHPSPPNGPDFEKKLLRWWYEDARKQMEKDVPAFRAIAEPGVRVALEKGASATLAPLPDLGRPTKTEDGRKLFSYGFRFRSQSLNQLATGLLVRAGESASTRVAVVLSKNGGGDVISNGRVHPVAAGLLDAGIDVLALNLLMQGQEGVTPESPTRKVANPREFAGYTFGYNDPLIVQRAHDVMMCLGSLEASGSVERIGLIALDPDTAPVAALAGAGTKQGLVNAMVLDTGGFRFQNVTDIRDPRFLPVTAKYGDLPGLLALNAPRKVLVMGEGPGLPGIAEAAYEVAGVADTVRVIEKPDWNAAVGWMREQLR